MIATLALWRLKWQLLSARVLLWTASAGRPVAPTPETHRYFADLYYCIAAHYERTGKQEAAERYLTIADRHAAAGGPHDLPPAASMAMPVPHDDDVA
jgi:hypothetical protein